MRENGLVESGLGAGAGVVGAAGVAITMGAGDLPLIRTRQAGAGDMADAGDIV